MIVSNPRQVHPRPAAGSCGGPACHGTDCVSV